MRSKSILIFLFSILLPASCGPKEDGPQESVLKLDPEAVTVDADGGIVSVKVYSACDWVVKSSASWIKPVKSSGSASAQGTDLSLNVSENTDDGSRTATVEVKDINLKTVNLTVTQTASSSGKPERTVKGIASGEDLLEFAQRYNAGKSVKDFTVSGAYKIIADIDCSGIGEWPGIGSEAVPFKGTFDGAGHKITGIRFKSSLNDSRYAGLFAFVRSATITNLQFGQEGDIFTVDGSATADAYVGAVAGYAENLTMNGVTNYVSLAVTGSAPSGKAVNAGGFCGRMAGTVESCINRGDVVLHNPGRASGFVAYCEGTVSKCTNRGSIIAPAGTSNQMGAAWGCSYCKLDNGFVLNKGYGHVGGTEFASEPSKAPCAHFLNGVLGPSKTPFDIDNTFVDATAEDFYDWNVVETKKLCSGVTYSKYRFIGAPRTAYVLEVDLTDPAVEVTTSYAEDIVPNPNANSNSNNGPKIRETLSQLCQRKRTGGMNVIAGVNSGFFDSNDGISRGPHIENGEPVYINNTYVRKSLPNHQWAFTVFTDGTASCGKKTFGGLTDGPAGKFTIAGKEFKYNSVNDTIVRHTDASKPANLYTYRYVKKPHPTALPKVTNALAKDAYYLVCRFTAAPMTVNGGPADAVVTAIHNGTATPLDEGPYVTGKDEFVLALSGTTAAEVSAVASVGTPLTIRCDMEIDGVAKPILTQNSTMYQFLLDGKDASQSVPADNGNITTYNPITFVGVDNAATKVWIIEVDGRRDWVELGVKSYDMYRIALKLGAWNMTRFDGGGSSCMWVYDKSSGKGSIVNTVSDSKGERSCLNYLLIREK